MPGPIPDALLALLSESPEEGPVRLAFERYLAVLSTANSGLFFFPEYTDHGPAHIRNVLTTAVALLSKKAWATLTSNDGAVLASSALLHDAAMFLTADSLIYLLTTPSSPVIPQLDAKSWPDLFEDFYGQARRWDGKTLFRILGDRQDGSDTADLSREIVHINERLDPEQWTIRYRKFLGEFVRRHHARLAHEIALAGFPSASRPLGLAPLGMSPDLANLAGFLARSHNMPLRSAYPYLDTIYDGHIICRSTHPLILMVLLRIADYLQLDATRVNADWLSIQRLRSPLSQDEWNAHLAVKEIRPDDHDPECLFLAAQPESAATFIKLKKTIAGLQSELDTSSAVLSEVYGRRADLRDLEITVRRVRSNLDDEEEYLRKHSPGYYPLHASFDTSGGALLKLMIRPLYGDRPDIGVRELLQNALDAVRELRRICENHAEIGSASLLDQEADVLISLDENKDGHHYITVSDKGIGMHAETVRDYFLKAGASFRQSDAWRKEFTHDNKSTVLRSGRFGIGALAAFLLGNRIHLQTRHILSRPEDGVQFDAGLDDEFVELQRVTLPFVGTIVKIRLDETSAEKLRAGAESTDWYSEEKYSWDWYTLDTPMVERRLYGSTLCQAISWPSSPTPIQHPNWRSIKHVDYSGIYWSFGCGDVELACNGIRVTAGYEDDVFYSWGPGAKQTPFSMPSVSVLDMDGRLPLTLHRNRLETRHLPFEAQLAEDMTKDFCAMLLQHAPPHLPRLERPTANYHFGHNTDCGPRPYADSLLWTALGTTMLHSWHIKRENITRALYSTSWLGTIPDFQDIVHSVSGYGTVHVSSSLLSTAVEEWDEPASDPILCRPYLVGMRMLVADPEEMFAADDEKRAWERLLERIYRCRTKGTIRFEQPPSGACVIELGQPTENDVLVRRIFNEVAQPIVIELFIDPEKVIPMPSPFSQVWDTIMGGSVIPYEVATRKKALSGAYKALSEHLESWLSPAIDGWRRKLLFPNTGE
jgi:molecular chaperone HtpG